MGPTLIVLGSIIGFAAILGLLYGFVLTADWEYIPAVVIGVVAVVALCGSVAMVRQGSWMYSVQHCDGIADTNPTLDVRHVEITYWSFGCYVDTGDAVIPWGRYRAVIDG